jgi:hypothetical protein
MRRSTPSSESRAEWAGSSTQSHSNPDAPMLGRGGDHPCRRLRRLRTDPTILEDLKVGYEITNPLLLSRQSHSSRPGSRCNPPRPVQYSLRRCESMARSNAPTSKAMTSMLPPPYFSFCKYGSLGSDHRRFYRTHRACHRPDRRQTRRVRIFAKQKRIQGSSHRCRRVIGTLGRRATGWSVRRIELQSRVFKQILLPAAENRRMKPVLLAQLRHGRLLHPIPPQDGRFLLAGEMPPFLCTAYVVFLLSGLYSPARRRTPFPT